MDRRRMMMAKKSRLPSEYQEVEWIESHGQEYIDIGLTANDNFVLDAEWLQHDNKFTSLVGGYNHNTSSYSRFTFFSNYAGAFFRNKSFTGAASFVLVEEKNKIQASKDSVLINGNSLNSKADTSLQAFPLGIFIGNNPTPIYGKNRLYYMILSESDIELRNFVPCYRKSDGVIGLYDLCGSICPLTGTLFYINSGTGEFTKGTDVN